MDGCAEYALVFKTKLNAKKEVEKHKPRLVAKDTSNCPSLSLANLRPNLRLAIMSVVSVISRLIEHSIEQHVLVAKRVLRYLKCTTDFGVFYNKGEKSDFMGFTSSDYARDVRPSPVGEGYIGAKAII
ncbi:hypothetical protein ACLB2K_011698 [Fragaria x ananassa]